MKIKMKTKAKPPKHKLELTGIFLDVVLVDSMHSTLPFPMTKTSVYYELNEMKFKFAWRSKGPEDESGQNDGIHPFMSSMTVSDTNRGFSLAVLNDDVKLFGEEAIMTDSWWAACRISEMISREFPSLNCKMELQLRVTDGRAVTAVLDPIVFQDFRPEEK